MPLNSVFKKAERKSLNGFYAIVVQRRTTGRYGVKAFKKKDGLGDWEKQNDRDQKYHVLSRYVPH